MDRVARKDIKECKHFRLSTEVRATLKRRHDSRVSKELAVFRALLKCILSFFQIVSGAIVQGSDEENKLAIKVCLEFITMCYNMSDVRVDATDSALQYFFTNSKDNDFQSNLHFKRKSKFLTTTMVLQVVSQLIWQVSVVRLQQLS